MNIGWRVNRRSVICSRSIVEIVGIGRMGG